mgnify:FL=1|tara:strand:+ start:314 stop:733 length:420 start_codon:yes stop_codon:yes gene_type:complete
MKKILALITAVFFLSASTAQAGDKEWSVVGKVFTGIFALKVLDDITTPKTVVVQQPQQVIVQPQPVVVQQQPVVVQQPIVTTPTVVYQPPVVYQQPTVIYQHVPVYNPPVIIKSSTCYRRYPIIRRPRARTSINIHLSR